MELYYRNQSLLERAVLAYNWLIWLCEKADQYPRAEWLPLVKAAEQEAMRLNCAAIVGHE